MLKNAVTGAHLIICKADAKKQSRNVDSKKYYEVMVAILTRLCETKTGPCNTLCVRMCVRAPSPLYALENIFLLGLAQFPSSRSIVFKHG